MNFGLCSGGLFRAMLCVLLVFLLFRMAICMIVSFPPFIDHSLNGDGCCALGGCWLWVVPLAIVQFVLLVLDFVALGLNFAG